MRMIAGTIWLYAAGQPIDVRSKPAFFGERLYLNRLRLALKSSIVAGLTL